MNKKTIILSFLVIGLISFIFWIKCDNTKTLYDYHSNSILASEYQYVIVDDDTLLHGKFVRYNKKGNKIAEGNYVYGEPQGKYIYYFDNGNVESIIYRKSGKIIEENIDNFPSGKIMRYTSYDEGLSAFIIRFDEKGNVESHKGYPIMEIYQYKIARNDQYKTNIKQYLKVGDTLKQQYLIANIPSTKRILTIENVGIDNTKVIRTVKKTSRIGLDVKEVLTKKGTNKIRAIVKYEFNDKVKTVINDTISFEVEVH